MREDTRNWIAERLAELPEAKEVKAVGGDALEIVRRKYPSFKVLLLAEEIVASENFGGRIIKGTDFSFAMNLPKDAIWTGAAIRAAEEADVAWGGLGDLMSAMNSKEVRLHRNKEFDFVERGLRQHSRVERLHRKSDRIFDIHRRDLAKIRVMLINEYELTAEHVRHAREKCGDFGVILKTNPNGRTTELARQTAATIGAEIFGWRELMGRLHKG